MELTVITPVYNGEKFLKETISSVLFQSYNNFDYIIINDGSIDNSEKIIKETKDSRINYIKQSRNIGKCCALNTALRLTKTPLVAFLDCDDILCENSLEKRVSFMESNPDIDLTYTDYRFIDKNSEVYGIRYVRKFKDNKELFKSSIKRCQILFSSVMLKKSLFDKIGYFDESYRACEDTEFFLRASQNGTKFKAIKEPLVKYRCHENSLSKEFRKSGESKKALFRLIDKYAQGSVSLKAYHFTMENLKLLFEKFTDKKIEYNPLNYFKR